MQDKHGRLAETPFDYQAGRNRCLQQPLARATGQFKFGNEKAHDALARR